MIRISIPQDEIRILLRQARNLHGEVKESVSKTRSPLNPLLGDLAVKSIVPHGYKGAIRSAGKSVYRDHKANVDAQWRAEGVRLTEHSISIVGRMSTKTKNLTMAGNSRTLISKFNRLTSIKTGLAYVRNLVAILEGIEKLDLIWNDDIEEEMKHRIEEKEWSRREEKKLKLEAGALVEEAKRSQFSQKRSILKRLEAFPRSRQSLISAFNQLQNPDPEAPRHCIISSRVAIEQLCIDAGASGDWKTGLSNICPSEIDRRQVKAVHHHLSGKGGHGGHDPSYQEAERCLVYTLTTIDLVFSKIQ